MREPLSIRQILLPTDFSEESKVALPTAIALAKWYRSELEILFAYPLMVMPYGVEAPFFPVPVEPTEVTRKEILGDLEKLASRARTEGVEARVRMEIGNPIGVILARAEAFDLVVMGTHGRGGFERVMLGSTTERVVNLAPCSVLTVGPASASGKAPGPPFRRILCALDLRQASPSTLDYAVSIARESQAHLSVLNVVDDLPEEEAVHIPFDVPEYRRYRLGDAREELRKAIPDEARQACRIEEHLGTGKPYREILRQARESAADLVVVGARGTAGLFHLGSTAQHVVRESSCPVLTVRAPLAAAANRRAASAAR
jgi:nucleotide-binding universal stress UspA family protein